MRNFFLGTLIVIASFLGVVHATQTFSQDQVEDVCYTHEYIVDVNKEFVEFKRQLTEEEMQNIRNTLIEQGLVPIEFDNVDVFSYIVDEDEQPKNYVFVVLYRDGCSISSTAINIDQLEYFIGGPLFLDESPTE